MSAHPKSPSRGQTDIDADRLPIDLRQTEAFLVERYATVGGITVAVSEEFAAELMKRARDARSRSVSESEVSS